MLSMGYRLQLVRTTSWKVLAVSHPFGDLIWNHLIRKKGLSQNRLAMGINQDPAVVARMCNGKALTGPQSRERVVQIIGWLHEQGVLDYLEEAHALLAAADKPILTEQSSLEEQLLHSLKAQVNTNILATTVRGLQTADTAQQEEMVSLPQAIPQSIPPNPYRGLFAFQEEDAEHFCGRDAFTDALMDVVHKQHKPMVAVIGPSGSGKSSVVFAGLFPRLRQVGGWVIATLRPSEFPLHALAGALIPLLEPGISETDRLIEINKQAEAFKVGSLRLQDVAGRIIEKYPYSERLLLIVDQFEELYTLCPDAERQAFLDLLLSGTPEFTEGVNGRHGKQNGSNLSLLITMRADFLGPALLYRPMVDALQGADLKLGSMTRQELRAVIEVPAEQLKVKLEDGLTERILEAVSNEPGDLPLLEFALTLLWARQSNGMLTHASYNEIGGVEKALARYAEEVFTEFSEQEQQQARRIFVQLVQPGEATEDTRRLANRKEVREDNWDLVTRLASARLVVSDRDEATGEDTVEIIHEAMIMGWDRLKEWVEADREFRTWQERLRTSMHQWEASGKDDGGLLRGVALAESEGWLRERASDLSQGEQDFIHASVALREGEQMERARSRRLVIVGLGAGLVITTILAVLALVQWQRAENQFQLTEVQRNVTERLRAQALTQERDPELGVLLAMEAISTTLKEGRPPAPQVVSALRQAILRSPLRLTLRGHQGSVWYASYSPDDRSVLTMSDDGTVRIWDASTGQMPFTLGKGSAGVGYASYSPDGRSVVTVSVDKTAKVWDSLTGQVRATLKGHTDKVRWAAFSPDGNSLITCSNDGTARLWNTETWKPYPTILAHDAAVYWATYSSDGKSILTLSEDNTARVWDVATMRERAALKGDMSTMWDAAYSQDGRFVALAGDGNTAAIWDVSASPPTSITLSAHTDRVTSAAFSPDGRSVVTSSKDRTAKIWEVQTGRLLADLTGHEDEVIRVTYSPDGKSILTASADGTAKLWDAHTGQERATLHGHTGAVWYGAFSSDGRSIITASADKTAKIWDANGGQERPALIGHNAGVWSAIYSPDGSNILTVSADNTARIWNATTGRTRAILTGHSGIIAHGAYSPDGKSIVTASKDSTAKLWDAVTGQERTTFKGHADAVEYVEFSPDGKNIVTASYDKTARVWDAASGQLHATLAGHTGTVWYAKYSPDGNNIVTASDDGTARVWDAHTGKVRLILKGHTGPLSSVAYSPDGFSIVTASYDHTARVWNASNGQLRFTLQGHSDKVQFVSYSPDGKSIVTTSHDKTAKVWDASTGQLRTTLRGHTDVILRAAYSPDGRSIVTVSADRTAKLWDGSNGEELSTLPGSTSDVVWAAYSPDGRSIVTASLDGKARQYAANLTDLASLAANRVSRALTPEERATYLGEALPSPSTK